MIFSFKDILFLSKICRKTTLPLRMFFSLHYKHNKLIRPCLQHKNLLPYMNLSNWQKKLFPSSFLNYKYFHQRVLLMI